MKTRTRSVVMDSSAHAVAVAVTFIVVLSLVVPVAVAAPAQPTSPAAALVEQGVAALARSEFINAENEFRRALAADPSYALAHSWTGQVFALQPGREKEALDVSQKAADMTPEDGRVLALLADVMLAGDDPKALSIAEKAASLAPDDAIVQSVLALAYLADAQWEKAQSAAATAVKLDGKLARAHHALGSVYAAMADPVRAKAAFDEAVRLEPKAVRWRLALAGLLATGEEMGPELREYEAILKNVPDYAPALIGAARVYRMRGMPQNAEDKLARIVKVAPNAWQTRLLQGDLEVDGQNYVAAESHYQRGLALAPGSLALAEALADALYYDDECSKAKDLLEQRLETHPHVAALHRRLAYAYNCLEDYRKELAAAEQAVKLDPYDDWNHFTLAVSQSNNDRGTESLESYGRAAAVASNPGEYVSEVGEAYWNASDPAQAEQEYAVANRLLGETAESQFALCGTRASQEKYQEALPACEGAHLADPRSAVITRLYGFVLAASGQPAKGVQMLELALHDEPDSAFGHQFLGVALMKLRKYKEALAAFETYLEQTDESDEAIEQLVGLLKQGYPLKDQAGIAQLNQIAPQLLKGKLRAQITGKTAKDRTLVLQVTSGAKATNEEMLQDTVYSSALAAHVASRLDPPVAGASIRTVDSKGKLFLAMKAGIDGLQNIALNMVTNENILRQFEVETGAPAKQGVTSGDIERIGKDIGALRELQVRKPISVTMISQADFAQGYEAAMTDEMIGRQKQNEALFRLLGALSVRDDLESLTGDLLNEQVLGYYDSETDELKVLKDKTPDAIQQLTVAHEYVHALQDQNFALLGTDQSNGDADLALRAVVEGDASLAAAQYAQEGLAMQDLMQMFGSGQSDLDQEALDAAPEFLSEMLGFPYIHGLDFVSAAFDRGGWKAVNDLYTRPPSSTEQVLHPERYRANEAPARITLPKLASAIGGDWAVAEEDVIGELGWRALLQAHVGRTFARQAAEGWGGDRYVLLKNKAGEYSLGIQTEWDSETESKDFDALLRLALDNRDDFEEVASDLLSANPVRVWQGPQDWWAVKSDGKRVAIAIAKSRELAEEILSALTR